MSARYNPIPATYTESEKAFLLAFEANETEQAIVEKRDALYFGAATTEDTFLQHKALSLATRLETVAEHMQRRLNRRYQKLNPVH